MKKIAFCTTCMNRIYHLQETLIQNIEDNFHPEIVEFVLLDYNSTDGLEDWCKNLQKHIDLGILNYYKTNTPAHYSRGHSRNMAFRLSNAGIVCNLDADNYLGKGFALHMIDLFDKQDQVFYTPTYKMRDITGRVCVKKSDFVQVRGYNENMECYGFEDIELYSRLIKSGLEQKFVVNAEFGRVIQHSHEERLSEESLSKHISNIYVNHINPYTNEVLLLNDDRTCKLGLIKDNGHTFDDLDYKVFTDINQKMLDDSSAITLTDGWHSGVWSENDNKIMVNISSKNMLFHREANKISSESATYYEIDSPKYSTHLLLLFSEITNRKIANDCQKPGVIINLDGIGAGIVFKNFDENAIVLL